MTKNDHEMTFEEAEQIIKPEMPELTSKDIELAALRYLIEMSHEHMFEISWAKDTDIGGLDKDFLDKWSAKTTNLINSSSEIFDLKFDPKNIEGFSDLLESLNSPHCGDCTGFPATCNRCYAETFFRINTAPPGKSIGSHALYIYNLNKEK